MAFLDNRARTFNTLIARAGDQGERPPLAFEANSSLDKSEEPDRVWEPAVVDRPQPQFPAPLFAQRKDAALPEDAGVEARRTEQQFQSRPHRQDFDRDWSDSGAAAVRPEPRFPEPINHWPDLPDLFDDDSLLLPIRDPTEFEAEHKAGKWSA